MGPRALDIMQKDVVTVSADLPLIDVHRLFITDEIHGAPVVDEAGEVLGVISSADLLRAVAEEPRSVEGDYLRELIEFSDPDWTFMPADARNRISGVRASDVMTCDVVQVPPDAPVAEIARALCENRVHRVLVMDESRLVGIISTFDLVAGLNHPAYEAAV